MRTLTPTDTQDMFPNLLQRQWHESDPARVITAISMGGSAPRRPAIRTLVDRVGRRAAICHQHSQRGRISPPWGPTNRPLDIVVDRRIMIKLMVQGAWWLIPAHLSGIVARTRCASSLLSPSWISLNNVACFCAGWSFMGSDSRAEYRYANAWLDRFCWYSRWPRVVGLGARAERHSIRFIRSVIGWGAPRRAKGVIQKSQ